jgi:hypothetical protein
VSDVIHLLGEGGAVFEMTLPLDRHIARRYEARELLRVNPDGSEYEGPEDEPDEDHAPDKEPIAPQAPSKAPAKSA